MRAESISISTVLVEERVSLVSLYNASRASAGCYPDGSIDFDAFQSLVEGEEIHVARLGDEIVGFVSVWVPENFIHHLYVAPRHQSAGIGSALLQVCAARYGLPLSLKCDVCNSRAQRFYRKLGWRPGAAGVGEYGPWEHLYSPRA